MTLFEGMSAQALKPGYEEPNPLPCAVSCDGLQCGGNTLTLRFSVCAPSCPWQGQTKGKTCAPPKFRERGATGTQASSLSSSSKNKPANAWKGTPSDLLVNQCSPSGVGMTEVMAPCGRSREKRAGIRCCNHAAAPLESSKKRHVGIRCCKHVRAPCGCSRKERVGIRCCKHWRMAVF